MLADARHRDNIKHGDSIYDHRDDELEGPSQKERERERHSYNSLRPARALQLSERVDLSLQTVMNSFDISRYPPISFYDPSRI